MDIRHSSPFGVGIITIITVLLVLTLSIFAALTFSSARADLALSEINAQTVQNYSAADALAAEHYAQFASGSRESLEDSIPIDENQSLHLHLERDADGRVVILAWETVPETIEEDDLGPGHQLWGAP